MKWTEQREILMDLVADVSDEEVIASEDKLKGILNLVKGSTVEDQRKRIKTQKAQVKKDIDALPARIDEATRAIPETISTSESDLKDIKADTQKQIHELQDQLKSLEVTDSVTLLQQEKAKFELELSKKQTMFLDAANLQVSGLQNDYHKASSQAQDAQYKIKDMQREIKRSESDVTIYTQHRQELLEKYRDLKTQTFDDHETICPTCGQPLPASQINELQEKFNVKRSKAIEENVQQGKSNKQNLDEAKQRLGQLKANLQTKQTQLDLLQKRVADLKAELDTQKAIQGNFEDTPEYQELHQKITAIADQLSQGATQAEPKKSAELKDAISGYRTDIDHIETELAKYATARTQKKRIEELEDQDAALKQTYNDLEKQSYLLDQFTRAKVNLLEQRINEHFELVSFKLFEEQKNGELKETCEAMVDGVPYSDLNNAARINAGLDIINTLSKHYALTAPIFVDNAESINELMPTQAQQISLIVSKDKQLKVVA